MQENAFKQNIPKLELNDSTPNMIRSMNPKLDIPRFNGQQPRMWMKKCMRYFELCRIPNENWVNLASLHMTDKAESWVCNYLAVRKNVEWNDFIIDLTARFKDSSSMNLVEQFNKLQKIMDWKNMLMTLRI